MWLTHNGSQVSRQGLPNDLADIRMTSKTQTVAPENTVWGSTLEFKLPKLGL